MSLSTRRPVGIPSSVRPPRSASTTRGRAPEPQDSYDLPPSLPSGDNKYRTQSPRSRSVPRSSQGSENPFRSRRAQDPPPPMPPTPSRHSVQSSVSSSSSGSSAVSAASTAPSSVWDYVGWKGNSTTSPSDDERVPSPEPLESRPVDSSTLWSRMAAVTGGLNISVGKPWEAKDDLPEPDTPPGRDSRITTALKKHYIKQVSDPHQLPAWLFSDVERQVGRSYSRSNGNQDGEQHSSAPAPQTVRSRARHDDAYAQSQPVTGGDRARTAAHDDGYTGPTRAATRLKALRDAKRGPVEREAYVPPAPEPEPEPTPKPVVTAPPPRPRVGLPSRPVRVRKV